jgi:DNA-binding GntR family transcriptional regulator
MNKKRQNQAQFAYKEIRKSLMARSLKPGERLAENAWAEKLNVNRADVKQAMSRLQGEGLLQSGLKGGFFVRQFTDEEMNEIYEVRIILETAAAERAIKFATKEELDQLESIAILMQDLAEKKYLLGLKEADLDFHEMLIKCSHNKKLEQLYQTANLPISIAERMNNLTKASKPQTPADHLEIVKSIRSGDKDNVINILKKQFDNVGL